MKGSAEAPPSGLALSDLRATMAFGLRGRPLGRFSSRGLGTSTLALGLDLHTGFSNAVKRAFGLFLGLKI